MHPPVPARVLSVADYESIRSSREMLLRGAGYSVISVSSDCALTMEIPRDLAIAIIGQTVEHPDALRIAARLGSTQADVCILRLTIQYQRPGPEFGGCCFVEDGPEAFLSCVEELVRPAKMRERSTSLRFGNRLTVHSAFHARSGEMDTRRTQKMRRA